MMMIVLEILLAQVEKFKNARSHGITISPLKGEFLRYKLKSKEHATLLPYIFLI